LNGTDELSGTTKYGLRLLLFRRFLSATANQAESADGVELRTNW